ncbi:MAG: hypothetical protein EBR82_26105 [Caulobacteraceae bacterium]|nr:hypothetical protein [Caulobacteraceae bacterium]
MSWPIIPNNDDGQEQSIPLHTLLRWYLYDVAGDDAINREKIFGLSPVSKEGHQKELEESEKRIDKIEDLLPLLTFYSIKTAEYAFAMHKDSFKSIPGISEEMLNDSEEALTSFYTNMAFSALLSSFASLNELGIIKVKHVEAKIKEVKKDE